MLIVYDPLARIPGQVKIMKEFVSIKFFFLLNLAFGQEGEKNKGKN
jgi:hypothetical protein